MSHDLETLLRDTLTSEADAAVPWGSSAGTDPWPRVERAHRRSRARRRAAAAVTAAAVVLGGVLTARLDDGPRPQPAGPDRASSWTELDDGRTRGELPSASVRAGVADLLAEPCCGGPAPEDYTFTGDPSELRFLWAGDLGGLQTMLVRAPFTGSLSGTARDMLAQVRFDDAGVLTTMRVFDGGPAAVALPYVNRRDGVPRMLVVVRRGASAASSRGLIRADGTVEPRRWEDVQVTDGVVDVAIGDPRTYAPTELRVDHPGSRTLYVTPDAWARMLPGLTTVPVTDADLAAATTGTRGDFSPAGVRKDLRATVEALTSALLSDPAHTEPAVFWAGGNGRSQAVVVATAGYPGQGRVLLARGLGGDGGIDWEWWTTVPASPRQVPAGPLTWRVPVPYVGPTPTGHVVGWLLPDGATDVRVSVDGTPRPVATREGLGWLEVGLSQTVRVQATLPGGGQVDRTITPADAEPPFDPDRPDLFPPG